MDFLCSLLLKQNIGHAVQCTCFYHLVPQCLYGMDESTIISKCTTRHERTIKAWLWGQEAHHLLITIIIIIIITIITTIIVIVIVIVVIVAIINIVIVVII